MAGFDRGKQRVVLSLAIVGVIILIVNLALISGADVPARIKNISLPMQGKEKSGHDTPPDPNVSQAAVRSV